MQVNGWYLSSFLLSVCLPPPNPSFNIHLRPLIIFSSFFLLTEPLAKKVITAILVLKWFLLRPASKWMTTIVQVGVCLNVCNQLC